MAVSNIVAIHILEHMKTMLRCLYLYQGMVEPGDTVSATLKKEFGEEAMNSLEATPEEKRKIEEQINELFSHGEKVSETCI